MFRSQMFSCMFVLPMTLTHHLTADLHLNVEFPGMVGACGGDRFITRRA
jgi:hypothetical protein